MHKLNTFKKHIETTQKMLKSVEVNNIELQEIVDFGGFLQAMMSDSDKLLKQIKQVVEHRVSAGETYDNIYYQGQHQIAIDKPSTSYKSVAEYLGMTDSVKEKYTTYKDVHTIKIVARVNG